MKKRIEALEERLAELEAKITDQETELEIRDGGTRGALGHAFTLLVRLLHEAHVLDERIVRERLKELFCPNPKEDEEEGRVLHQIHMLLEFAQREATESNALRPGNPALT